MSIAEFICGPHIGILRFHPSRPSWGSTLFVFYGYTPPHSDDLPCWIGDAYHVLHTQGLLPTLRSFLSRLLAPHRLAPLLVARHLLIRRHQTHLHLCLRLLAFHILAPRLQANLPSCLLPLIQRTKYLECTLGHSRALWTASGTL